MKKPRLVDLTLTLTEGMRGVAWEAAKTLERDGWNARTLHLYSHCGTHMDAPHHFGAGPGTIDRIPLDRCCLPAWVANLEPVEPRQLHRVADLGPVAERLRPGEGLLLRTGWSRHVHDPAIYRDALPRVSEELARWCVERGVALLGVEPPSVADVHDLEEVTRIHRLLLGSEVVIVEGLQGLDALAAGRVWFVAAPLKVDGGDGAPCRAFAIDNEGLPPL